MSPAGERGADRDGAAPVVEAIVVCASPLLVYDMLSDVTRMGQWSPEATGARAPARPLRVGDRFIGTNRRGHWLWWTTCRVTAADRPRRFAFDVGAGPLPISTWEFDLTPVPDGVRVTQTWHDRRSGLLGRAVSLAGSVVIPGDRGEHNRATMRITLARLKAEAERTGE